jgi:hypothetical protein
VGGRKARAARALARVRPAAPAGDRENRLRVNLPEWRIQVGDRSCEVLSCADSQELAAPACGSFGILLNCRNSLDITGRLSTMPLESACPASNIAGICLPARKGCAASMGQQWSLVMADHFISIQRGEAGLIYSDFVHGTASCAHSDIELRIRDGAGWTKKEVIAALAAFERFVETAPWVTSAGLDVKV